MLATIVHYGILALATLGWCIILRDAYRLGRTLSQNLTVLRRLDKALLRLRYPFTADRWPDWVHRVHFLPLSWVVPLARYIDEKELALLPEADEHYEIRRQAAWDAYFEEHPEVLASHAHQNGGWPPEED